MPAGESSVLVRLRLLGASSFARDAGRAGRGLGTLGTNSTKVTSKLRGVTTAAGKAAGALRVVGSVAGLGAAYGLSKGVGAAVNFEQEMANVQARLLTTKGNMELLSQQALDLGGKTSFSANEAAQAMSEFAAAGFGVKQIMSIMPGTLNLAAASGTDLAMAAETTGAVIRQFGLHAGDASHVADVLTVAVNRSAINMDDLALSMKYVGPVAGRFNQSLEDMGASVAILGNVGIKGETAGTTLRRALVNIVKPSKRTIGVLDELGITQQDFSKATVDAQGKLRPMPQMLGNIADQMKGLSAPDRRRAIAQLFGVEALPGMLTLMGKGRKGIEKMSRALTNSGGAAKRTAGIMRGTVKGAWDQFTGSLETASIKLTRRFNPPVRNVLKGAAGGVTDITQGLLGETGAKARGGPQAADHVAPPVELSGMQKAGLAIRGVLQPLFKWVGQNAPKVGRALLGAGKQLIAAFAPAMPFVRNVLLPLLKGIAMGVIGGVVAAFKIAVPIIRVVATVLGFLGNVLRPLKGVFVAIGGVIGLLFGGAILKVLSLVPKLGIVFRLLGAPLRLVGITFRFVGRVIGKLAGVVSKAWTWFRRWVGFLGGLPGKVGRIAVNIVGSIVNGIASLPGKLFGIGRRAVGRIASGLTGAAGSVVKAAGNLGKKIIEGIVNFIKGAPNAVKDAVLSVLPGPIKGAVNQLLGGGKGVGDTAKDLFRSMGRASGGPAAGLTLVGERGPELVDLPKRSYVHPAPESRRIARRASAPVAGGGGDIVLTANLHLSGKQIHTEVFRVDRQMAEMA